MNEPMRSDPRAQPTWHLLQVSDALDEEFGSALAERVPLLAWKPERSLMPLRRRVDTPVQTLKDPVLTVYRFPLVRGFARFPWTLLARTGNRICEHLLRHTTLPERSPLICTSPYFAPVAERWPGPVVYWLTDLMARYQGASEKAVHRLDTRMCRAATLVFPNSARLANYLEQCAACPVDKIRVLPNATRSSNLLPAPAYAPMPLPEDVRDVARPIAGVIGNLAGNMDWTFLEQTITLTPDVSWVFVGPTTMPIEDPVQSDARERVMHCSNVHFVGKRPYGSLASYARAFDVAVLPYRRCEPTYSGSSTRFYEHLAACRPMVVTRGFHELLSKESLLHLVDTPAEANSVLRMLQASDFDDGATAMRWHASREGTWQVRAACMVRELESSLQRTLTEPQVNAPRQRLQTAGGHAR